MVDRFDQAHDDLKEVCGELESTRDDLNELRDKLMDARAYILQVEEQVETLQTVHANDQVRLLPNPFRLLIEASKRQISLYEEYHKVRILFCSHSCARRDAHPKRYTDEVAALQSPSAVQDRKVDHISVGLGRAISLSMNSISKFPTGPKSQAERVIGTARAGIGGSKSTALRHSGTGTIGVTGMNSLKRKKSMENENAEGIHPKKHKGSDEKKGTESL
jgi:hypothetical protein